MNYLYLLVLIVLAAQLDAKEKKYPSSEIPEELKKSAHAVIRAEVTDFEVQSASSGLYTKTYAVTILNKKGERHGYFYHHYFGKTYDLQEFKGTLYDAQGEEVKKFKKSDLADRSRFDGFSVYSDSRYQFVAPSYQKYPYTIEYHYVEKYRGMMFYPSWDPQRRENLSVMQSAFKVKLPKSMELRYKEINLIDPVQVSDDGDSKSYRWEIQNLSALDSDQEGDLWSELTPRVITGPNKFVFGGYSGDMSSWKSYGKWQQKLNDDLGEVPEVIAQKVKQLVSDAPDDLEKIRRIYNYLQSNTRYVSIQLGIGGWQPFAPELVSDTGYGDCKALSYYTQSMLKSVGIRSLYTIVNAGSPIKKIHTDFPSDQFNHVFLCVPMQQDTVWLECTSQTNPFGYLGSFTSDRPVLLITEEGGKIVHTPAMGADDNMKSSSASVQINEDGSAQMSLVTDYKGLFSERIRYVMNTKGHEERKKWLYNNMGLPSFVIDNMEFTPSGEFVPQVKQQLEITMRKAVSISGKRMFLQPNLLNRITEVPKAQENRRSDFVHQYSRVWNDTIAFEIPQGFHPEFIPESIELEEEFASYSFKIIDDAGTLKLIRRLEHKKGRFSPQSYQKYRDFCQSVVKADKAKVVLRSST